MSRKSALLALAAIASLSTFALSATDASARGFGGGGGFHGGGFHGGGFHGGGMHLGGGFRGGFRGGFHGGFHRPFRFARPFWHHHHHWRWGWWWRRPYWVAPVIAGGVATTYAAAPTYNRCTCLTKEYTQEGAVVFKDVCTQETAMNPPAAPGSASYQEPAPQAQMMPQQGSAMPPQAYAAPQPQPYPQYR
jgi:hypothetical protein